MARTVILGAGAHARETLEILLTCRASGQEVDPIGFIDDRGAGRGTSLNGFPILGDFGWFEGVDRHEVEVVCAIGTPATLRALVAKAQKLGLRFTSAISPRALISGRARVGTDVVVFPQVVINTEAVVGDHVTLNVAATVSHDSVVGDFANINPGAHLAGNVHVGESCYIGMGANVIQGTSVGARSVVGAGACVIRDVPPDVTVVGVPARVIKGG